MRYVLGMWWIIISYKINPLALYYPPYPGRAHGRGGRAGEGRAQAFAQESKGALSVLPLWALSAAPVVLCSVGCVTPYGYASSQSCNGVTYTTNI